MAGSMGCGAVCGKACGKACGTGCGMVCGISCDFGLIFPTEAANLDRGRGSTTSSSMTGHGTKITVVVYINYH